ncbi:hypothetical protein ANTRET_LOCUS9332 [Anthophora retusa]
MIHSTFWVPVGRTSSFGIVVFHLLSVLVTSCERNALSVTESARNLFENFSRKYRENSKDAQWQSMPVK